MMPEAFKQKVNTRLRLALVLVAGALLWSSGSFAQAQGPGKTDASAALPQPVVITASAQVIVDKAWVYVADIVSLPAAGDLLRHLGEVRIGAAPAPGRQKTFIGRQVAETIQSRVDLPAHVHIQLPDIIRVQRSFQPVPMAQLKQFLNDCLASHFGDEDFNLIRIKSHGTKLLPRGKVSFRLSEPIQSAKNQRVTAAVTAYVDKQEAGPLKLTGWINRFEPVVCARRTIPKNTVLTDEDVALEMINTAKLPSQPIYALEDVQGMRARRKIQAGTCLRANMVEVAPLVLKGTKVKLVATNGVLNVSTIGIAQEAGGRGEQIRIQNLTSGKVVIGEVADASTVKVFF